MVKQRADGEALINRRTVLQAGVALGAAGAAWLRGPRACIGVPGSLFHSP